MPIKKEISVKNLFVLTVNGCCEVHTPAQNALPIKSVWWQLTFKFWLIISEHVAEHFLYVFVIESRVVDVSFGLNKRLNWKICHLRKF